MNISEKKDADLLETVILDRDLSMFICTSNEDNDLLMRVMKEQKLRANVTVAPNGVDIRRRDIPQQLRALGFRCFLSDLVAAPAEVMQFLCGILNVRKRVL